MNADPTCIGEALCVAMTVAIKKYHCLRLIESGTYFGQGSTRCILAAIAGTPARFITIEANVNIFLKACENLTDARRDPKFQMILGQTVPGAFSDATIRLGGFDFVFLDSNEEFGWEEFLYVKRLGEQQGKPYVLALDDTNEPKHNQSVKAIVQNEKFEVLDRSDERYGHLVARWTP